jgi:hypothetical protein
MSDNTLIVLLPVTANSKKSIKVARLKNLAPVCKLPFKNTLSLCSKGLFTLPKSLAVGVLVYVLVAEKRSKAQQLKCSIDSPSNIRLSFKCLPAINEFSKYTEMFTKLNKIV